jgi:hypothetical protein
MEMNMNSQIYTKFSQDSKIVELCNELYERLKENMCEVNTTLMVSSVDKYTPVVDIEICNSLSMSISISPYNNVNMPYYIFSNMFQMVSDTNQFNNFTILLYLTNFEKETFIECAGQSIEQLLRIYNTINKKIEYESWTNISAIDPTKENIARLSRQMLKFWEENARITYCVNYRPETINSQEFEKFKNYIDLFKRWLYTIDVTNKDNKEFEKLFTETFSLSYHSKLSDFNNLRNVLIFALYESLKVYSILLKYFDNEKEVKQIVQKQ